MSQKTMGTKSKRIKQTATERTYARPSWVPKGVIDEEQLCPDCFKVVGSKSRYSLVCTLGKNEGGLTVGGLTKTLKLTQPTITHHLNALRSVDAVSFEDRGRERIYRLNRGAHCFLECKIPF